MFSGKIEKGIYYENSPDFSTVPELNKEVVRCGSTNLLHMDAVIIVLDQVCKMLVLTCSGLRIALSGCKLSEGSGFGHCAKLHWVP